MDGADGEKKNPGHIHSLNGGESGVKKKNGLAT